MAAPAVRDMPITGTQPRTLHAMIDAVNLRITDDPGTDSMYATTGIGRQVTFTLTRDRSNEGEASMSVRGGTCTDRTRVAEFLIAS